MRRIRGRIYLFGALGIVCLCLLAVDASAQGTLKTQLNISGTAADSVGNPISGMKAYRVRFYDDDTAGTQLGSDLIGSVTLSAEGVFNIPIDPPVEVAAQGDVWYELALDTDDDGLDSDDIFAERVPIHGVPFAHNADLLDGQDSGYYLDATNMTGTVPSARLNLTNSDVPDDITIQLASEALSATQAASATNALLLEGQPGSYYLDATNLTGTVPSARLNLTDSDIPDDITIQLAAEALSATQAASATNALLLEGQPGSYYLDATNLTGTIPSVRLSLTDSDIPDNITIQLASEALSATQAASATNALLLEGQTGSYYLDATNLTGTIPSARLSLTDSDVPDDITIFGGTIDNSAIGSATPAAGVFTTLISSGTTQFEGGSIMLGKAGATNRGRIDLHDATDATDYLVGLLAPSNLVGDVTWTLPSADGTSGQMLGTDGAGNLSFSTIQVPLPGSTIAIGDSAAVSLNGVAVGVEANGINYGTAVGYQTKANTSGSAFGYRGNAESYGTAVGYQANGYDACVAVGYRANAFVGTGPYSGSVSVGYQANSYSGNGAYAGGVAVGYRANARHNVNENTVGAVAIGLLANAYVQGVAIGGCWGDYTGGEFLNGPEDLYEFTCAYNQGVAVGFNAVGYNHGTAIGFRANASSNDFGSNYSTSIGYRANAAEGKNFTFAKGSYSKATRYNEEWKGADAIPVDPNNYQLSGNNKYGYGQVDFYGTTTTALATEIFLGGSADKRFTLQDNSAVCFTAYTVAVNTATGDTSIWQHSGGIKRRSGANTTVIVGSVNALQTSEQSGLTTDPTFTADTTNGSLKVSVTGVTANSVMWNVMLIYSEVRE